VVLCALLRRPGLARPPEPVIVARGASLARRARMTAQLVDVVKPLAPAVDPVCGLFPGRVVA